MTRKSLAWVSVLCAVVLSMFAVPQWGIATDSSSPVAHLRIDRLGERLAFSPGTDLFVVTRDVTRLSPLGFALLGTVGIVWSLRRRRWDLAAVGAIALPLTVPLVELVLKPLVGRTSYGHFMYPSGHSSGAAASAMYLLVVIQQLATKETFRRSMLVLACFPVGEAFALTVLRSHWFTDTIGGIATGIGWIALTSALAMRVGPTTASSCRAADAPAALR